MDNLDVLLIIGLVLGVIWSNIALLKYSAKFKVPVINKDPLKLDEAHQQASEQQKQQDKAS
ncbi:DUF2897 family protein [Paraferrimonas sp. SM1919]|uniref:DUF2897 family protein n=1 Tax=Paraferrimonas sp. SM1919 TaxID=2662263 RepID=UPI0013D5EC17|nr:DUF2897 family protein [Paraferrimonas sp. SM1919]